MEQSLLDKLIVSIELHLNEARKKDTAHSPCSDSLQQNTDPFERLYHINKNNVPELTLVENDGSTVINMPLLNGVKSIKKVY